MGQGQREGESPAELVNVLESFVLVLEALKKCWMDVVL